MISDEKGLPRNQSAVATNKITAKAARRAFLLLFIQSRNNLASVLSCGCALPFAPVARLEPLEHLFLRIEVLPGQRSPMAVIAAGLAVVMAAVAVQPAAVCPCATRDGDA